MLVPNKRQRRIYVELAPRYDNSGAVAWNAWVDITPWFLEQLSDITYDIDDVTFEGRIQQSTISLKFNNIRGNFRKGASPALWSTTEFIYHSRIRYYDWIPSEDSASYGVKPTVDPLFDGLIAENPEYNIDGTCVLHINSKLDILRDHYFLDNLKVRVRAATSLTIINTCINLLDTSYSALGVTSNGGLVRNSVLYTDITPYDKDLLTMLYEIIDQGGGFGGLKGDDLIFSFFDFDTQTGSNSITKQNFTTDVDTVLLYHFDDTDYSSGTGTTLDDKSANGYDATVPTSEVSNVWDSNGFFDNKCRVFYYYNDDGASGVNFSLTDFTVEMVLEVQSFIIWSDAANKQDIEPAPLFCFTEDDGDDTNCYNKVPVGDKTCGCVLDGAGKLFWCSGEYETGHDFLFHSRNLFEIDQLPGENQTYYLALSYDASTGVYKYYLDGNLRKQFVVTEGAYEVDDLSAVKKVIVRGYQDDPGSVGGAGDSSCVVYTSGFKLSDAVVAASDIQDNYYQVYGQEANIYTSAGTIDDHTNKNLLRINSYDKGTNLVKNLIIYEKNTSDAGVVEFSFDDTNAYDIIFYTLVEGEYTYANTIETMDDLVGLINYIDDADSNKNTYAEVMRETYGISAEIGDGVGSYNKSVIIRTNGRFDYRKIFFGFYVDLFAGKTDITWDDDRFFINKVDDTVWDWASIAFSPAGVNNFIISRDDTSITEYGMHVHKMPNLELVNTELDKQSLTDNYLNNKFDAKDRLECKVVYKTITEMFSKVLVSIRKEYTSQIPFMQQEGGNFIDWTENGNYREKNFFVVGIRHDKDGKYTQLKLREV